MSSSRKVAKRQVDPLEGRLVRSIGAAMDPRAFEEWVRAEVSRKIKEGLYPPELLKETEADQLRDRVDASRDAAELSLEPPMVSGRPLLGRLVMLYKLVVARALRWYTRWMVSQVQAFGASVASALEVMEERLRDHERRIERLSADLARWTSHGAGAGEVRAAAAAPPGTAGRDLAAWRYNLYLQRPAQVPGRVLVVGSGAGDLLRLLRGAGVDCYAVLPDGDLADTGHKPEGEVRVEDPVTHIGALPAGCLSAVFTGPVTELEPERLEHLLRACAHALADGGALIAETRLPSPFDLLEGAAGPDRAALGLVAQVVGFREVRIVEWTRQGATSRLIPVPSSSDPALAEVIDTLNSNLRLIDEAVFGPRLGAVIARR